MLVVRAVDPTASEVAVLVAELDAYQAALYPAESNHFDPLDELAREHVRMFGAFDDGELLGCGAVKQMTPEYGEIKRMFVLDRARGRGVATSLLDALERHLLEAGVRMARLETGIHQPAALRFYERQGYRRIGAFGSYAPDPLSVFMEKSLDP